MFATKNDISEPNRSKLVKLLNARLADAVDLQLQAKQAHWNVKGPNFIGLHKLFDDVYEAVAEYVDLIAERVVQLGGVAEGTVQTVAKRTTLDEYPMNIADGSKHVEALSNALAEFGQEARRSIDLADDLKDKDTADLFTEVSRGLDKWLWFVESHLQAKE